MSAERELISPGARNLISAPGQKACVTHWHRNKQWAIDSSVIVFNMKKQINDHVIPVLLIVSLSR